TYQLPEKVFPLSRPLERPVSVLEVLLEEPRATVEGARLGEVAAAAVGGRSFRRFLGQDVPGSAVMRLTAPPPIARNQNAMRVLAVVMALAMLGAFGVWYTRRRERIPVSNRAPAISVVDDLTAQ